MAIYISTLISGLEFLRSCILRQSRSVTCEVVTEEETGASADIPR